MRAHVLRKQRSPGRVVRPYHLWSCVHPMVPWLARHLIVPLHERLVGRRTFAFLHELMITQSLAPDELRALQRSKLRDLLMHAASNTRFYRQWFREAGVDVQTDDPLDVLAALPLLDKATIRDSLGHMLWRDAPGGLTRSETGGSTGEPLIFYFGRRRQAYDQAARMRSHRWFGVDVGERELYLWGSPIEWTKTDAIKRFRDSLSNHLLLNAFEMSPARMDHYLDVLDRYRPSALYGYPSSLALWADHARGRGRSLNRGRLKAVFVTGETCSADQREKLEKFFGVPVADGYGSREGGFIAHQCPQGSMHITAENILLEIVDPQGQPVAIGESGEIVVTHLDAYAMPLIRYRTGDLGRLKAGRCACGRGLPMMDVIEGRVTDFIYLPDGTIKHALSIIYPLRQTEGMRQFRVTQSKDYRVLVEVVADDRAKRISREAVIRSVRPVLGDDVPLEVRLVDHVPTSSSGKHHHVVSHVQPNGVAGQRRGGQV